MPGWLFWSFALLAAYILVDRLMVRYIHHWDRDMLEHTHDHRAPG